MRLSSKFVGKDSNIRQFKSKLAIRGSRKTKFPKFLIEERAKQYPIISGNISLLSLISLFLFLFMILQIINFMMKI